MIFTEQTHETGYRYHTEDVFGVVDIESSVQLVGPTLDAVVSLLLKGTATEGTIAHEQGTLSFTFARAPMWTEDDEPCNDTPTSTSTLESASIATDTLPNESRLIKAWNWCKRLVGAFREAWRKTND